jgi:signal transduction histidine kinase
MRERSESLGGRTDVSSEPGHGARVHAQVPAGARPARRTATTATSTTPDAAARGAAAATAR